MFRSLAIKRLTAQGAKPPVVGFSEQRDLANVLRVFLSVELRELLLRQGITYGSGVFNEGAHANLTNERDFPVSSEPQRSGKRHPVP